MSRSVITYNLTNDDPDLWLDQFEMLPSGLTTHEPRNWSVRKRTLRGGLRDGVDIIEVCNGPLSFSVLPTRGMGLWKGNYKGTELGWRSPVRGPVHPKFVNLAERGGLGWLRGFDEWLCRCGLNWNGPPGDDTGEFLTLHGRIANTPAYQVKVGFDHDGHPTLVVSGIVEESGLFSPRLRMHSRYRTVLGSNAIEIRDSITNHGDLPAEVQLLYHINLGGSGYLHQGSEIHLPIDELTPLTDIAAAALPEFHKYRGPEPGFAEQVYAVRVKADGNGWSLALLQSQNAKSGFVVRWAVDELPYCIVWKNTVGESDGYVTGIEPATGFPRFRASEREAGRVIKLDPVSGFSTDLRLEMLDTAEQVAAVRAEIDRLT